ncbi:rhomboid-domain-containing protein [Hyaloscypha variabilis F]|uniref:Rhomboid-domain-containing protein n=1 Tax=Hyaloscypha variabilis (strain UAMH 11265 / GT02V1 / F) TaxID=1149755 RepID=A0A2J6SD02_HYAVF|nr:rhomboid-domain-containing protein [Hyaloscypha variabilis F]
MNSLWPATSRLSCLDTRTIFRTCCKVDSLAARLAQRSVRPYSISALPFRSRELQLLSKRSFRKLWQTPNRVFRQPGSRTFASQRIVTKYLDLPRDYTDEDGLDYRVQPLSETEARAAFGDIIDARTANRYLKILHGRRVAGTLADPGLTNVYEERFYEAALAWLRKNVPVDEVQCAGLRAEQELAEMEQQIVSDAERIGLYKPNSGKSKNVYGKSGLDSIRKSKEREFKKTEALKMSQADEIRHNTGTLEELSARSQVELRRPGEHPKLKYYMERSKVLPDTPPEMSKLERLWPSALFVAGVVLASYLFTQAYTPPRPAWRVWPDMPPSAATIIGIFLANSIVLFAWRIPAMFRALNKFFITVPGYPRAFSLLGNTFSHQTFSHFGVNMTVLWFVGTRLHEEVGRANFLAIYISSGAIGSLFSLTSWVMRNNFVSASLGASGAICGIVAAYLWLNSSEAVRIFGVFPPEDWPSISALGFLVFLIGLEIATLNKMNAIITVDHWAHLGGYAAGIASAQMLRMQARRRKAIEGERKKHLGDIEKE